ncbi:polyprenyl synthetase family protein [Mycobacterium xenopi 4042]|uniref:Polyprenyl synthetase family protein n=1 Tax=Mycobacterium xenopi 4042 TaxID=1299334 RepID=X8EVU5_MYCXE|nr:polyprenyl synthetase family protein [Mycobacterium xenopi 4042]
MLALPTVGWAYRDGNAAFETWRASVRDAVLASVADFVATRCAVDLRGPGADIAAEVVQGFVGGGKCVRSTFALLAGCAGRCRAAALRAAASLELLHAFALLQDDVMDDSPVRRGRASAHVQFACWHRDRGLSGSSSRFGESAAMLLGDLCLVWAEQMLREADSPATPSTAPGRATTPCGPNSRSGNSVTLSSMPRACPVWLRCSTSRAASRVTTPCAGRWKSEPSSLAAMTMCSRCSAATVRPWARPFRCETTCSVSTARRGLPVSPRAPICRSARHHRRGGRLSAGGQRVTASVVGVDGLG